MDHNAAPEPDAGADVSSAAAAAAAGIWIRQPTGRTEANAAETGAGTISSRAAEEGTPRGYFETSPNGVAAIHGASQPTTTTTRQGKDGQRGNHHIRRQSNNNNNKTGQGRAT